MNLRDRASDLIYLIMHWNGSNLERIDEVERALREVRHEALEEAATHVQFSYGSPKLANEIRALAEKNNGNKNHT